MFSYSKWIIIFTKAIPQGFSSTKAINNGCIVEKDIYSNIFNTN